MHVKRLKLALRRLTASAIAGGALLMAAGPTSTQTAVANGDTRTINLYHAHTKETISATFRVNGSYDGATLKRLNWFLRDWRNDDVIEMDPRLFDVIWEAQRGAGSTAPIQVNSAYRSPATNAMLRRRSRGVAEHSQHMLGKAMDIHVTDVPISQIRETAMRMQRGGVGYYASSSFVHLDVGSVRAWPRMSYDQLARLFPDGKTVHLPSNGQPLARYEEARAELAARGGGAPTLAQVRSKSFLATLFGWDDEDDEAPVAPRGRAPAPVQTAAVQRGPVEDGSAAAFYAAEAARRSPSRLAAAEANRPRGQTYIGPAPTAVAAVAAVARPPEPEPAPAAVAAVAAPLPPPRPAALLAALAPAEAPGIDAPLPPIRPRALVAEVAAPVPPVRRSGVDQIAGLIGAPVGKVATTPGLPSVITDGRHDAPVASPSAMLAYAAPASSEAAIPALARAEPKADLRGTIRTARAAPMAAQTLGVRKARLSKAAADAPALTPARLDRSNFVALTDPQAFAAHAEAASALGATLAPLRGAARKEAASLMFSASPVASTLTAPTQGFARLQ